MLLRHTSPTSRALGAVHRLLATSFPPNSVASPRFGLLIHGLALRPNGETTISINISSQPIYTEIISRVHITSRSLHVGGRRMVGGLRTPPAPQLFGECEYGCGWLVFPSTSLGRALGLERDGLAFLSHAISKLLRLVGMETTPLSERVALSRPMPVPLERLAVPSSRSRVALYSACFLIQMNAVRSRPDTR
ncbi:hypothetical protein OE88DRAFT_1366484 [Heliocybe sulcata]|uniref:Uncharacterized protein n=1 Tax=Heliocybe sulcata TaxID=5364 RepID=A0A5C3N5N7_9AGAM|nr:hypothetical protein OE88DRAFT_1366484 [Heliocybe sulcata]